MKLRLLILSAISTILYSCSSQSSSSQSGKELAQEACNCDKLAFNSYNITEFTKCQQAYQEKLKELSYSEAEIFTKEYQLCNAKVIDNAVQKERDETQRKLNDALKDLNQ